METAVAQLFTPYIKQQAAAWAGTQVDALIELGSFENYVFEFAHKLGPRILRLTHSSHRSLRQVQSELDFVQYLADNGVKAAAPIANAKGSLAEAMDAADGSCFIVSVFQKAPGVGKEGFEFGPEILVDWGRITGQMHRLAKTYRPSTQIAPRYHWHDDPHLQNAANDERLDERARARFREMVSTIKSLPADKECYGLIHTDLHQGNFFVHDNRLVAFDFDDCCYQHFVHDVAIPLYYALWKGYNNLDHQQFASYFLKHFVNGYRQENTLPSNWLQQLPLFLGLRSFVLYAVLTQKLDPPNATQKHLDTLEYCRKLATGELRLFEFDLAEVAVT